MTDLYKPVLDALKMGPLESVLTLADTSLAGDLASTLVRSELSMVEVTL